MALTEDGPAEDPATMHALDTIAAQESGLETFLACVLCGHKVEGGWLSACPECGGALVLRIHKRLPGEVGA